MRLRRTTIAVALAAALTVPAVATMAGTAAARSPVSLTSPGTGSGKTPEAEPTKTAKADKKIKFDASGTVAAVDATAGTVTVAARGGTKDVRGKTVTVSVPASARVVVNGARQTLAEITAGYRIAMTGTRAGGIYTATKVAAAGKRVRPAPGATVRPSPSDDDVTPEPSEAPEPSQTPHA